MSDSFMFHIYPWNAPQNSDISYVLNISGCIHGAHSDDVEPRDAPRDDFLVGVVSDMEIIFFIFHFLLFKNNFERPVQACTVCVVCVI